MKHLRKFDSVSDMQTAIAATKVDFVGLAYDTQGGGKTPKVRIAKEVPPSPYLTCKYNVTSTTSNTPLLLQSSSTDNYNKMWIDGVEQQTVVHQYTFGTTGEHTVEWELKNNKTLSYDFAGNNNLISVVIPPSVTTIESQAFNLCRNLTSVTIPDSVTSIGGLCFGSTKISTIVLPKNLTSIQSQTFSSSSLTAIEIPDKVTLIGDSAFSGCFSLTSVTIPNSVTSIGEGAFSSCGALTSATIPNSVTSIGAYAFRSCDNLTNLSIGNSVATIGGLAFQLCNKLISIICNPTTPPTLTKDSNYEVYQQFDYTNDCPIYVPAESVNTYKSAPVWSEYYANRIQAIQ